MEDANKMYTQKIKHKLNKFLCVSESWTKTWNRDCEMRFSWNLSVNIMVLLIELLFDSFSVAASATNRITQTDWTVNLSIA